ncbi:MAG: hypothetical protein HKN13_14565 [Rhodothermales bacterium]|nr:hypothetical protein [Rhodothermales bacterium]
MKRPTFLHGVVVAAVLAFAASVVIGALTPFVGVGSIVRLVIPATSLAYVMYLLRSSTERVGRLTTLSLWSALAITVWWIGPPLPFYVLVHVGAVWLVRSLYFYSGIFPALMDLGLSAMSVTAFIWAASRTGSVFLAAWSFFLVQALFVVIPATISRKRESTKAQVTDNESFDRARRQADQALQQLFTQ